MPISDAAFDPLDPGFDKLIRLAVENDAPDDYVRALRKHAIDTRKKASTIAKNDAQTVDVDIAISPGATTEVKHWLPAKK